MVTSQIQSISTQTSRRQQLPKLGGFPFFAILGILMICDILGVVMNLLITAGLGLSATVIGAIPGIPLAVIGYAGQLVIDVNAFLITFMYYWYNKVPLMETKKLATIGVSVIMEVMPFSSILPMMTTSFFVVVTIENLRRKSAIVDAIAGKAIR